MKCPVVLTCSFERDVRVMKGYNGNWDLPFFGLGKWELLHWDWDATTGKGINNIENGN